MKQLPDDMMRQFWQESKKEAPLGFSDFIMQNLPEPKPLPAWLKKPLLSLKAAGFLAGLLIGLGILLGQLSPAESETNLSWYQQLQQGIAYSLAWMAQTPGVLPALAVLSVALVALVGLDKLLKRLLMRS